MGRELYWTDRRVADLVAVYRASGKKGVLATYPQGWPTLRALISAAGALGNTRVQRWDKANVERLRRAYAKGGRRGALAAFPGTSWSALESVVRRFALKCEPKPKKVASAPVVRPSLARRNPEIAERFAALDFRGFAGDFGAKRNRRSVGEFV